MPVVRRTRVIRRVSDRQFLDRGRAAADRWAKHVTQYYIRPRTPMLTGELRASLDQRVNVTAAKNISITWYARAPHAEFLEDVEKHGAHIAAIRNFTTPNTEAPFLRPNVERAMPTVREAVREMLIGG